MIDFYERHKSDRFEFVAFHDGTAKSFAELDPKLEKMEKEHWRGRKLPFPILLDASGETIRRFGVHGFPTQILIDPQGQLVGTGDLETTFRDRLLGAPERGTPQSRPASLK